VYSIAHSQDVTTVLNGQWQKVHWKAIFIGWIFVCSSYEYVNVYLYFF